MDQPPTNKNIYLKWFLYAYVVLCIISYIMFNLGVLQAKEEITFYKNKSDEIQKKCCIEYRNSQFVIKDNFVFNTTIIN